MGIYDRKYYQEDGLNLAPTWNQRSAVSTLILINVAVFIGNALFGGLNDLLTLSATDIARPQMWWRVLTYGFAHDARNIGHLLSNMLGLYFLGRSVEDRYGRNEFYRIYLIAIVLCGIGWLIRQQLLPSNLSSAGINRSAVLGASGAVICIEMLFVYNFPRQTVYLIFFPVPAWVLGILLVLFNLSNQPGSQIAFDVHLMGIAIATIYFFGHFSFSFLEDLPGAWRKVVRRLTGPRLTVFSSQSTDNDREASDAAEADRILAKIHASGQDSLTSREKKFLEKYSKTVRSKRQSNF